MNKIVAHYDATGRYVYCGLDGGRGSLPHVGVWQGEVDFLRQYHDIENDRPVSMPPQPSPHHSFDYETKQWVLNHEAAWESVRRDRNKRLQASDWTQLPDVPIETREAWAEYRQALRDVTLQPDPLNIVWPTPPS